MKNKLLILCLLTASNHTIWSSDWKETCPVAINLIFDRILPIECKDHGKMVTRASIRGNPDDEKKHATFQHADGTPCNSRKTIAAIIAKQNEQKK